MNYEKVDSYIEYLMIVNEVCRLLPKPTCCGLCLSTKPSKRLFGEYKRKEIKSFPILGRFGIEPMCLESKMNEIKFINFINPQFYKLRYKPKIL